MNWIRINYNGTHLECGYKMVDPKICAGADEFDVLEIRSDENLDSLLAEVSGQDKWDGYDNLINYIYDEIQKELEEYRDDQA